MNAARAAGVQAIDSVFSDVADMDGLRAWAEHSHALGFEGMGCIHPRRSRWCTRPSRRRPRRSRRRCEIVAAFDEAQAQGLGVVSLGSKMIDPPVVNRALKLVHRARQMGLVAGPATDVPEAGA